MASIRQIEANRRNAEKSTGPKTVEGKARAAANLPRMSLEAMLLLSPESQGEFEEFAAAMEEDLRPETNLQRAVFRQMVQQMWRVQRASRSEVAFMDLALNEAREKMEKKYKGINDPGKVAVAFDEVTKNYPSFTRLGVYEERAQRVALRLLDHYLRLKRMPVRKRSLLEGGDDGTA